MSSHENRTRVPAPTFREPREVPFHWNAPPPQRSKWRVRSQDPMETALPRSRSVLRCTSRAQAVHKQCTHHANRSQATHEIGPWYEPESEDRAARCHLKRPDAQSHRIRDSFSTHAQIKLIKSNNFYFSTTRLQVINIKTVMNEK